MYFRLLQDNMKLFMMEDKQEEQMWLDYVLFLDSIIYDNLLYTIGIRYI